MRKILFCLGSMNTGGAERVVCNLANDFQKKGCDVVIVTNNLGKSIYQLETKIKRRHLDTKNRKNNIILRTYTRIRNLRKIIVDERPDAIVTFLPEPTARTLLATRFLKNVKVIVSVRNNPETIYNNIFKRAIMHILYPFADGFVFQTDDMKSFFPKKIREKSVVIPNPINPVFITKEPFCGSRKKTIVSVGRLEKQKNHRLLINAFSEVHKSFPDYKLVIYGEGNLRDALTQQIAELDLQRYVSLPGESRDIRSSIYDACCFVLPSDFEGMPNALMEAMALGLPCIATDCPCGGPKFLIQDGTNGLLVPVGDKQRMAESILAIISQSKLSTKLSLNAITLGKTLNPEKINNQWAAYINRFLK